MPNWFIRCDGGYPDISDRKVGSTMEKDTVRTISNGKSRKWESRDQAKMYYLQLAAFAEGDERQRYMNILVRLAKGMKVCSDKKL